MKYIKPATIDDATLVSSNVAMPDATEAGITVWAVAQSISVGNLRVYHSTNKHWVVRALVAHTTSLLNAPTGLDTDTNWVKLYDVNRWRMFDNSSTSQTENADSIDVTFTITEAVNALALFNLDAASVEVTVTDINNVEVYNHNEDLQKTDNIYDAWTYFFEPIVKRRDLVLSDLPIYYLANFRVQINNVGSVAKCGVCAIGRLNSAGFTEYGMKTGIRDYSVKATDEFGNTTLVERKFKKTMSVTSEINSSAQDGLMSNLVDLRATPCVYIGADKFTSSYIYGFFSDFYVVAQYPTKSIINIEIEGLA